MFSSCRAAQRAAVNRLGQYFTPKILIVRPDPYLCSHRRKETAPHSHESQVSTKQPKSISAGAACWERELCPRPPRALPGKASQRMSSHSQRERREAESVWFGPFSREVMVFL